MKRKKLLSAILSGLLVVFTIAACTPESPPSLPNGEVDVFDVPDNTEVTEDPNALYDGKVIIDDNFDEGTTENWGSYINTGDFTYSVIDGELVIDIVRPGTMDYGCQCFRDGYALNMGGIYEFSFDVRCDTPRPIQWRFQLNGGDYHAYCEEQWVDIGTETQTLRKSFVMAEATDPAPRFVLNLGYFDGMDKSIAHKIYVDNVKLVLTDASNAQAIEPLPDPIAVKVNQVGYKPDDMKTVVSMYDDSVTSFDIIDASTGNTVYTGKFDYSPIASYSKDGDTIRGDFSDFKEPGTYYISVNGNDSFEFTIGEDVYNDIAKASVRMLTLQRCGMELNEDLAGDFAHPECHTDMARVYDTDTLIDVTGGWHDAGDYGRYVVAGAKTINDLFLTYLECDNSDGDDFDIPESGNGVPDILDEARYELDWMLKMQAPDGGVYHKVTCAVFPETVMPEEETAELIVCPESTAATGDFAAVMAKASVIYKDYDEEFANKCLEAAKTAYGYLEKYAADDHKGFSNPSDITTGEYPDKKVSDEYLFAAVELYLATGEQNYLDKAAEIGMLTFKEGLGWADIGTYAIYDYLIADDSLKTNTELTDKFMEKFLENVELNYEKSSTDAYASPLRSYPWGSNMNIGNTGIQFQMAYNVTGDEKYLENARLQLDYLLGINPLGYCYVTGFGSLSPEHVHHRPSQFVGYSMPGMVVGGPNSAPDDPYAKSVLLERSAGMSYIDNDTSFSTNEITIYWNSPFIYLIQKYK